MYVKTNLINFIYDCKKFIIQKSKKVIIIIVFISYRWGDRDYANGLDGFLNNPNNTYRHVTIRERDDNRNKGEVTVKNYLKGLIGNCNAIICLIGNNTHNSNWVQYELEVANSQNKKIIPVRIPNTSGGVPDIIRNKIILRWNANEINDEFGRK